VQRSPRSVSIALALLFALAWQPSPATATRPDGPPPVSSGPGTGSGAVVLPTGRVLPPAPPGLLKPSEMALALKAHANDRISFKLGGKPRPLPGTPAVLSLADPTAGAQADLIPLAPTGRSAPDATLAALPNGLKKQVFGFLPYWMLNASDLQWMRYGLVSTIAYFGVAARSDGSLATTSTGWSGWNSSAMTGVINAAHAKGSRVVVTITMMAWDSASAGAQATLLGNATYRTRLVNNIVATVRNRNADGVNLDFEPLATSQRANYTSFVRQLKAALVRGGVGSYLTVCTTAGAATWATGYDLAGLTASGASDGVFAMGYDYSWSGSSRAGGVAPMESSYMLDVNQSVTDFLSLMPASKLIWGVPYYGRTWRTTSSALNATTVAGASGYSKAYYYTGAKSLAAAHGRRWDSLGQVPWFVYYDNTARSWIQGYYDDTASLGVKYDMINRRGLGGMGMWHLLMDGGVSELWNLIANRFQKDTVPPAGGIMNLPTVTDGYSILVRWRAIDVGAGVATYTVQYRDRSSSTWFGLTANTTATSATFAGIVGHTYEFRVSAKDRLGTAQPWVPAMANPGTSIAVGRFASVASDLLNVRSGAGTGFDSLVQLTKGQRVAVLSGPVSASGYQWYQVQFGFSEWPSADYPRTGWAASGDSTTRYLVPAVAPTVTRLQPWITAYAPTARIFSPNGDGRFDSVGVRFTLPAASSSVRLDVLNSRGATVDSTALGARGAGQQTATWDGRLANGSWAPAGSYLMRLTASDSNGGSHVAPSPYANVVTLGRWGVTTDVTAPTASAAPAGTGLPAGTAVTARFSEPVTGVSGSSFTLVDGVTGGAVNATVSYDVTSRLATLRPAAPLTGGHWFRAALSNAIRDGAGNALAARSWAFDVSTPGNSYYGPARPVKVAAGLTTGYRFSSRGAVLGTRPYTLSWASSAPTIQRSKTIPGHSGTWLYVTAGVWAGYWIPESPRAYLPGVAERMYFATRHQAVFAAATYTGYRFDAGWHVQSSLRVTLGRSSGAATSGWAVINGRTYAAIVNGVWAGYWVPVGGGLSIH
jgi:spore germination protein YaaH